MYTELLNCCLLIYLPTVVIVNMINRSMYSRRDVDISSDT